MNKTIIQTIAIRCRVFVLCTIITTIVSCGGGQTDKQNAAERDSLVITQVAADSVAVFDLLRNNHSIDYTSSAMGVFVKEIDSIRNSPAAYWVYSVNGEMIPKASDAYKVGPGDTVRWHFRRPSGR